MIKIILLGTYRFGIRKYFKKALGSVSGFLGREDERRDLTVQNMEKSQLPKNIDEQQKQMHEVEQEVSDLERRRLRNIDEVIVRVM